MQTCGLCIVDVACDMHYEMNVTCMMYMHIGYIITTTADKTVSSYVLDVIAM